MQNLLDRIKTFEDGRYANPQVLGSGAFKCAVCVYDFVLCDQVVLKPMSPEADLEERLINEASALHHIRKAQIASKGGWTRCASRIATLYGVKQHDGVWYIKEEYCKGQNLADYLKSHTINRSKELLKIITQIAEGIAFMHANGIVHKDIKDENILYDGKNVKITDCGASEFIGSTPVIFGSELHRAPEEYDRVKNHPTSDIWAVGVMLYRCLLEKYPFWSGAEDRAQRRVELQDQIRNAILPEKPIPTGFANKLLLDVCWTALSKDPRKRYADGSALLAKFRRYNRKNRIVIAWITFWIVSLAASPYFNLFDFIGRPQIACETGSKQTDISVLDMWFGRWAGNPRRLNNTSLSEKNPQWFNDSLFYTRGSTLLRRDTDGNEDALADHVASYRISEKENLIAWVTIDRKLWCASLGDTVETPVSAGKGVVEVYNFFDNGRQVLYQDQDGHIMADRTSETQISSPVKLSFHANARNPIMTENAYFYQTDTSIVKILKHHLWSAIQKGNEPEMKIQSLTEMKPSSQFFKTNDKLYMGVLVKGQRDIVEIDQGTMQYRNVTQSDSDDERLVHVDFNSKHVKLFYVTGGKLMAYNMTIDWKQMLIKGVSGNVAVSTEWKRYFKSDDER